MFIVIGLLLVLLVGRIGYLVGEPTPTPASVEKDFHGLAVTNLKGKPEEEFLKFFGLIETLRVILETRPDLPWPEIKNVVGQQVQPRYRPQVTSVVSG